MSDHASGSPPAPRFFAVVPAAGRSARMGRPKLLLPWGQGTLIEHVIAAWRGSRAADVVAVVHPDDIELAKECRRAGADVVVADRPPPDMKSSVCLALARIASRHAPASGDAWLLAPADMPGLSAALIDFVIAAHDSALPRIVVPRRGNRRGHPVLFPWALAADVPNLAADEGLNALLKCKPVIEIDWPDPNAFADVDSPEDYRRLRGEGQG